MTWWDRAVTGVARRVWIGATTADRVGGSVPAGTPEADDEPDLDLLRQHLDAVVAQARATGGTERFDGTVPESEQQALEASTEAVVQAARDLTRASSSRGDALAARKQLDAVRRRAEGWRNGVSVTFGLILASLAIKPGEGFMLYEGTTEVVLRWLVGLSVLLSLAGLMLLVRAAHGPGWLKELTGAEATAARFEARARGAYFDFWCGRWAWAWSLVLFIAAVTLTWFVDPPA